ncbi:unnamed protein product [Phytomonas sp. Hart1]|nr:unnamed protein product [Phytomonas sp. Hart1]|eukprot:CCW69381.1 unnamed protein product [Phytomonas sp. isolate Hart1]
MLVLAHRLMKRYIVANGIACSARRWWFSRLRRLLQEGLLDWLLFISVGHEDEDIEKQRKALIQSVLGEDKGVIAEDTTRGAASCKELLLRDGSSQRTSYLLTSFAILGCPAPLDKDDMNTLLSDEFCRLVQLLVDHQTEFSDVADQSQLDSEAAEGTSVIPSDLGAIIDTLSNVLRMCAVYYKYFGCIPENLSLDAAVKTSDPADGDSFYALIVRSSYLRREIQKLMLVLDTEVCAPEHLKGEHANCDKYATVFSNGQILEELLQSILLGRFALHILLALLITNLERTSMVYSMEEAFWRRWLSAAAAPDAGNALFRALFQFMREFHRSDPIKQVGLLRLLHVWVHSLDPGKVMTPLRACLLERHIFPHILTDRSRCCPRSVVDGMVLLLINTLSPIPPTQSNTCDVAIFKWTVHTLTEAWTTVHSWHAESFQETTARDLIPSRTNPLLPLNILVLLHLLLERAHGREMSERYSEVLLPVLSNIQSTAIRQDMLNGDVIGFHAATVALLCGLLKDRLQIDSARILGIKRINGGGSFAMATASLRKCWICLPVLQCRRLVHHECKECRDSEEKTALLLCLKAQVISAFRFIFLFHTDRADANTGEVECVCDGALCPDDEYHASLCLLNWCMELVLARDVVWAEPSCHVIYTLLNHYRATLATSQEVLAIYLCCLRCGPSMLSATQLGVLLSALLYVAPHLPWTPNGDAVHKLVHHFLTTVDPTVLPSDLTCSQPSQKTNQTEVLLTTLGGASATVKMYEVLSSACRYYGQIIPQAPPLSLHRLTDFLAVSSCSAEGSSSIHLFVQNQAHVNLFVKYASLQ